MDFGMDDGLQVDVAIIGAGVSGVYSGWRLLDGEYKNEASRPNKVHVFELSDRIGGRLESVYLPGISIAAEIGGMRYLRSQEIVTTLIEDIFSSELTSVDFPLGDDANHYRYMRTQRFKADAWTNAQQQNQKFATHYYLRDDLVGFNSDQLFNKVIYDVLVADPWFVENHGTKVSNLKPYQYTFELTAQDWDDIKPNLTYQKDGPYKGMKVNDMGFWNLIKDQVGEEAYEFLSVAGGYYSNTINWNAAEAFPYMVGDFSKADVSYRTIDGGYDQIANILAQRFVELNGGPVSAKIWGQNRLQTFNKAPEGSPYKYALTLVNQASQKTWTVYANVIVLAMPRRSLELLDQDNFFFEGGQQMPLRRNIDATIPEPSFKLLMGFETPWWTKEFNATAGESLTDLPMRQCYYFGTDPSNSHSILLASYNDMRTTSFWSVLESTSHLSQARFKTRPTRFATREALAEVDSLQASAVMVQEAVSQLRELHGPTNPVPEPYVSYFKDWTRDPFGGGYHAWKAGVDVKSVMPYMRRPKPDERIHICGEAYSDQQGWIEGAFCVAEKMLQEHFDVSWPSWLDADYYLGW
ncbi:flavin monoamine oxidase family protein [Cystobacter fuscus]|nr:NAD(P)/FAD-dependent oxidoreductase [Cystobacter fuscus]